MSNIRSLHGAVILPPGQPDQNIIKVAEEILDRARSGDLNGLAYVMHHSDDTTSYEYIGRIDRATIGTLEMLKLRICKLIDD